MKEFKLKTNGLGPNTKVRAEVICTSWSYNEDEIKVYLSGSWNVQKDGYICGDPLFEVKFKNYLSELGYDPYGIKYNSCDMQEINYVSFLTDYPFRKSFESKMESNDTEITELEINVKATVVAGVRWSNNIITELLGNYNKHLAPKVKEELAKATMALGNAIFELGRE